ncbi:MAG TPA: phenylacetate--CoA ligase family protein [Clostridiales bacterium]|nr:phenylacetate--CoA ligase family protein [Clostridiales bacterium]
MGRIILGIYYRLPVFLQDVAISLYGLVLYASRYSGVYKRYLKLFSENKHDNLEKEKRIQNKRFLRLLRYAATGSPFYREFYRDIPLQEIRSVEDIGKLPILSKAMLKENLDRIYTIPRGRSLRFSTGGTGGIPLVVRKRPRDVQQRMAYLDAYKLTFGFRNNKMKAARFFGKRILGDALKSQVFWRNNYPLRQRLYSTYHLTQENLPFYVRDLNRFKPQAIDGFVSAIYIIAKYMEENNITPDFRPKAVFTTSETVLPYHRETIERVFGCPLSDQYASNEGAPFIIQCSQGSYHEAIDTGVFEHIPTEAGIKLLVTGFDTYGTPLIRYDIGDMVMLEEGMTCPCGSVHPVIKGIAGREAEFLETGKGRLSQVQLSVLVSQLSDTVSQMQFRQRKDGSLDILCILTEPAREEISSKIIYSAMKQFLGEETVFRLHFTETIDRAASGKYQLIVKDGELGSRILGK